MSLPRKEEEDLEVQESEVETYSEPHSEVYDPVEPVETPVVEVTEKKTVEKKAVKKAVHSPGKYVASTGGNVYHEPKCDWAKRIVKKRMLWFKDKRAANRKGYRGHSCVK